MKHMRTLAVGVPSVFFLLICFVAARLMLQLDYSTIEDEVTPYSGKQAQVIAPDASHPLATTPYAAYEDGAIVVRFYSESSATHKVSVSANGRKGTYPLSPDNSTMRVPLIYGEGSYTITFLELLSGGAARTISTQKIQAGGAASPDAPAAPAAGAVAPAADAAGTPAQGATASGWTIDTSDPYLAAVVDIDWSDGLTSVKRARVLAKVDDDVKTRAKAIYSDLVARLAYDFSLVGKLPSGYVPNMDTTYNAGSGICYDFASLYAGMCRSVGVQAKVVMGYNDMVDGYHAWNEIYDGSKWHRVDLVIDTQLRAAGKSYSFGSPKGKVTVTKSY